MFARIKPALVIVPLLTLGAATQMVHAAHARDSISPASLTQGREVAAPPWSFACMTDHGPSACGEPMWVYGTAR